MSEKQTGGIDISKALNDPASVFDSPESVVRHPDLDTEQKARILKRWEYDAAEAAVATEEGMPSGDGGELLQRIAASLDQVTDGFDVDHVAPSKQHGLPDDSNRGDGEDY